MLLFILAVAYLATGLFITGFVDANAGLETTALMVLWPLMPVFMVSTWVRELGYAMRRSRRRK